VLNTDVSGFTIYDIWLLLSFAVIIGFCIIVSNIMEKRRERKSGVVDIRKIKAIKERSYDKKEYEECHECNGSGQDVWSSCISCEGKGIVKRNKYEYK
jgi:hypothetical protein